MASSISSNNNSTLHEVLDDRINVNSIDQDSKKNLETIDHGSNTVSHNNNTETWKKIGILALFIIGTAAIFAGLAFSGGAPLIAIPIIGLGLIGASVLGYYFRSADSENNRSDDSQKSINSDVFNPIHRGLHYSDDSVVSSMTEEDMNQDD